MNICVFCASSSQVSDAFKSEARLIGQFIAENGHTLIYGGATGGLMDAVAEATHELGGEIIGVVPDLIVEKGRKSDLPTQTFQVETMSERKELMKEYADVFVVLAGGFGTLDELFDVVASGMVGYHDKQTILVNSDDYFAGLLQQIDRMTAEGLGYKAREAGLHMSQSAEECTAWLTEHAENV